jgi:hypothetical protein
MKAIFAVALISATLGGCAKASDSSAASDTSSPAAAADAASPAAGASATASDAPLVQPSMMYGISGTEEPDKDDASATAAASAAADAGGVEEAIPVYPGANEEPDRGLAMSSGTVSVKMNMYKTSDDAGAVVNWYKAHLPASWHNFILSNGGKTVGTFSLKTEKAGNAGTEQTILVSADSNTTQIQITTKKGN